MLNPKNEKSQLILPLIRPLLLLMLGLLIMKPQTNSPNDSRLMQEKFTSRKDFSLAN